MADKKNRVPVREQAPEVRAKNFEEVCLGYNKEEAMEEASRCLNCKNARCITGCPVNINIPAFIAEVKEGNFEKASQVIGESSALPAVCGRVVPSGIPVWKAKCILGIKGEPVSIGKLERLQQIGQERTILHLFLPRRRKARRLLLSVPVLQD